MLRKFCRDPRILSFSLSLSLFPDLGSVSIEAIVSWANGKRFNRFLNHPSVKCVRVREYRVGQGEMIEISSRIHHRDNQ